MLATRNRFRTASHATLPAEEARFLADAVARRTQDIDTALTSSMGALLVESGTAFLVTRVAAQDVPLFSHAKPDDVEFGVAEEPRFPLLSVVTSLQSAGGPRFAGLTVDIGLPEMVESLRTLIAQSSFDLVVLDPAGRIAAIHRFELSLWSRARAHRVLAQARRHLDSIPPAERSYPRALAEFQAYCTENMSA